MIQFAVALKDTEWTVFRNGVAMMRGTSRSEALKAAEDMAFNAEETGEDVELLVQDYTGELRARYSGGAS